MYPSLDDDVTLLLLAAGTRTSSDEVCVAGSLLRAEERVSPLPSSTIIGLEPFHRSERRFRSSKVKDQSRCALIGTSGPREMLFSATTRASIFVFSSRLTVGRCLHISSRHLAITSGVPRRQPTVNCIAERDSLRWSVTSYRNYSTAKPGAAGRHWYIERVAAVGLLALIPTGLIYPNPVVDYGLAVLVPLHGHWGLMAVVEDYVPQVLKGVSKGGVYLLSIGAFLGLMYLNVKDIGICGATRALWAL